MGDVQAKLKVMPESAEVDLEALGEDIEDELPDAAEVLKTDTEDVAFGLQALIIYVSVPDSEGGTDPAEEAIDDLDDVESVRVEEVTRT